MLREVLYCEVHSTNSNEVLSKSDTRIRSNELVSPVQDVVDVTLLRRI